jgi:hypothetical protein
MSMLCGFQRLFRATLPASFRRNPIGDEVAESPESPESPARLQAQMPDARVR